MKTLPQANIRRRLPKFYRLDGRDPLASAGETGFLERQRPACGAAKELSGIFSCRRPGHPLFAGDKSRSGGRLAALAGQLHDLLECRLEERVLRHGHLLEKASAADFRRYRQDRA